MTDEMELPSSSTSGVQVSEEPAGTQKNFISPQESRCLPLDVEMIDQLLTLEALCPRARWIKRHRFPQRKYITA